MGATTRKFRERQGMSQSIGLRQPGSGTPRDVRLRQDQKRKSPAGLDSTESRVRYAGSASNSERSSGRRSNRMAESDTYEDISGVRSQAKAEMIRTRSSPPPRGQQELPTRLRQCAVSRFPSFAITSCSLTQSPLLAAQHQYCCGRANVEILSDTERSQFGWSGCRAWDQRHGGDAECSGPDQSRLRPVVFLGWTRGFAGAASPAAARRPSPSDARAPSSTAHTKTAHQNALSPQLTTRCSSPRKKSAISSTCSFVKNSEISSSRRAMK